MKWLNQYFLQVVFSTAFSGHPPKTNCWALSLWLSPMPKECKEMPNTSGSFITTYDRNNGSHGNSLEFSENFRLRLVNDSHLAQMYFGNSLFFPEHGKESPPLQMTLSQDFFNTSVKSWPNQDITETPTRPHTTFWYWQSCKKIQLAFEISSHSRKVCEEFSATP